MKNYSEMSDFEINKKVAINLGAVDVVASIYGSDSVFYVHSDGHSAHKNYCNSWGDAGPIIAENKICLAYDVFAEPQDGGKWVSQPAYGWSHERVRDDNPLRTAMIVFLMMKEEK